MSLVKQNVLVYSVRLFYGTSDIKSYDFVLPCNALDSFLRKINSYAESHASSCQLSFKVRFIFTHPSRIDIDFSKCIDTACKFIDYAKLYNEIEDLPF